MSIPVAGRVAEALRRSTIRIASGREDLEGSGSGVILTNEQVITNAHVVRGTDLRIESWEGSTVSASLIKIDRRRDLALLSAPGMGGMPASLGDSTQLRAGMPVVAVGNPLGFTGAVSSGVIHSIGPLEASRFMSASEWIYADVRLAPGNSGGPLADFHGQIVGINTMILAGGLALAIPSRAVQSFLISVIEPRSLGVVVRPVRTRNRAIGMMILELVAGGAAERSSLLPGDVLIAANQKPFRSVDDLHAAISQAPGALLHLEFYRGGQERARQVAVRLLPEPVLNAA